MTVTAEGSPRLGAFDIVLPDEDMARAEFARSRAVIWPDALVGSLLDRLIAACDRGAFRSDHVAELGHREIESPPVAGTAISLALRRPPLFRWLERVTGCAPIAAIEGRVVRTWPRPGDELTWHDDNIGGESRRLGVTIALGREPYEGGYFEMRDVATAAPLLMWKHDRLGAALVFEVSRRSEHRVHPLTSGGPRRVFTGWFTG